MVLCATPPTKTVTSTATGTAKHNHPRPVPRATTGSPHRHRAHAPPSTLLGHSPHGDMRVGVEVGGGLARTGLASLHCACVTGVFDLGRGGGAGGARVGWQRLGAAVDCRSFRDPFHGACFLFPALFLVGLVLRCLCRWFPALFGLSGMISLFFCACGTAGNI